MNTHKVAFIRCEHFNAAHRLYNPKWDDETNYQIFGKCSNQNYHGHNYHLEVKVIGFINPDTGYVIDAKSLSDLITKKIIDRFDHKNLNLDTKEFKNLNPTVENICKVIFDILRPELDKDIELKIKLRETHKNYAEYPG